MIIPLFTLFPLFRLSLSTSIVNIFGKFCGGHVLAAMALPRALAVALPTVFILFKYDEGDVEKNLPPIDFVQWWFFAAAVLLGIIGGCLILLNPYPIVKERNLVKEQTQSHDFNNKKFRAHEIQF